jgi:hypothetical protein
MYIEPGPSAGFRESIVYRDFVMNFDLRPVNGGGAAWSVTVKEVDH